MRRQGGPRRVSPIACSPCQHVATRMAYNNVLVADIGLETRGYGPTFRCFAEWMSGAAVSTT
eukprot:9874669-Ditylum_brightwellii.AAC.1